MSFQYTPHQKLSLRKHPVLNEAWLHDRICEDPSMLNLGDVRVLDRERTLTGGGRLDLILLDDENKGAHRLRLKLTTKYAGLILEAVAAAVERAGI